MLGDFIVLSISVLIFVASEFFLPFVFRGTPLENRQRHFYSILLSVFSFAMCYVVKINLDVLQKITDVEQVFMAMIDSEVNKQLRDIHMNYHERFRQPSLLGFWAGYAIESLSTEMSRSSVLFPTLAVTEELFDVYKSATDHIFATHVGSLDQYLEDSGYRDMNKHAFDRGIPIVRFYLFDGTLERTISPEARNKITDVYVRDGVTLSAFNKRVGELHDEMKTLMSVVIPPDKLEAHLRRDFLIADGNFLLERELDAGMIRVSGGAEDLNKSRTFLRRLLRINVPAEYVHHLDDAEVRNQFGRYDQVNRSTQLSNGEPLAKILTDSLLQEK